ncbi:MAG: sulfatase-like hydrolase/transferase, partial [Planctomycetota bacterium]
MRKILDALDQTEQSEQMLVVLTSDNGGLFHDWDFRADDDGGRAPVTRRGKETARFGHYSNGPLRGRKGDIYEGGHRVPLLLRWPETIQAKSVCNQTFELTDLFATISDLVGVQPKGESGMDSFSMLSILRGEHDNATRPFAVHHSLRGMFAIRRGTMKFVEGCGSGGFTRPREINPKSDSGDASSNVTGQLYDLSADPREQRNRFEQQADQVVELHSLLDRVRQRGAVAAGN